MDKRDAVLNAYPGVKWREKVTRMTDEQIVAVYFNLVRRKKI